MLVKDFITKEIPVLKSFDTGEYALSLMDDFKVKHLPIVSNEAFYYLGLISEKAILSSSDISQPIGNSIQTESFSVHLDSHLFETLSIMTQNDLSLIPVVSENNEYEGVVTREKLTDVFAEVCNTDISGSIITLEVSPTDYSATDIARIIESNDAHIITWLTHIEKENGRIIVTLKIDREDASAVIRSFERFNYTILSHFMKDGIVDDIFQQRMKELIHYMNI